MLYNGKVLPNFEIYYKPRTLSGSVVYVKEVDRIPANLGVNPSYGLYMFNYSSEQGSLCYITYNPYLDVVYVGDSSKISGTLSSRVINGFLESPAYNSYVFVRNPPIPAVGPASLQTQILGRLKDWILAGFSISLSILVLWFGYSRIKRKFLVNS